MANIPQRDPESGASDQAGYSPTSGDSQPYADTDRSIGGSRTPGCTMNIMIPQNKITDPVWGVNAPSGGKNPPMKPEN